jgi:nucleotide-binding universal stress UspA family protein
VKTLVCIDGQENASKAVRVAGKRACATPGEATFLFVQGHRTHTRTQVPPKTMGVSADLWKALPGMKYLLEAEGVFKEVCEWKEREAEQGAPHTALVQVGHGVFEVGRVQPGSDTRAHLRTRLGIPQEEILGELEDGEYDLLMLGAHGLRL